jgi:hypothetical protein
MVWTTTVAVEQRPGDANVEALDQQGCAGAFLCYDPIPPEDQVRKLAWYKEINGLPLGQLGSDASLAVRRFSLHGDPSRPPPNTNFHVRPISAERLSTLE